MADETLYPAPEAKRSWPAALIGAVVHTGLWLLLFLGMGSELAEEQRTFDELQVQLPQATRSVFKFNRLMTHEPILLGLGLAAFFAADLFILHRLGQYRALRELWSGLMVVLPCAACVFTATAVGHAHNKLTQALTRPSTGLTQAERVLQTKLNGKWKLVSVERSGVAVTSTDITLVLTENRFTWQPVGKTQGGTFYPILTRNPIGVTFWFMDLDNERSPAINRIGLLKVDGNKLLLCLGQPDALGEDLPIEFATKGTKNELYTFERAE